MTLLHFAPPPATSPLAHDPCTPPLLEIEDAASSSQSTWLQQHSQPHATRQPSSKSRRLIPTTTLSLNRRRLLDIPPLLSTIQHLDLSRNKLTSLPVALELPNLRSLNISYNAFKTFPTVLRLFANTLESLTLSHNQIAGTLPPWLAELTRLVTLKLDANFIPGHVPHTWRALSNIKHLCLGTATYGGNLITHFPAGILSCWPNVSELELACNLLSALPDDTFASANLTLLTFDNNHIEHIPASIHLPPNLTRIHAANNLLCSLPSTLMKCPALEVLDLSENALCFVPIELLVAVSSRKVTVVLTGNPFTRLIASTTLHSTVHHTPVFIHPEAVDFNPQHASSPDLSQLPPPCLPPKRNPVSLKELAARAYLTCHLVPDKHPHCLPLRLCTMLDCAPISRCPHCAKRVVAEYLSAIHVRPALGLPAVPVRALYCSADCLLAPH